MIKLNLIFYKQKIQNLIKLVKYKILLYKLCNLTFFFFGGKIQLYICNSETVPESSAIKPTFTVTLFCTTSSFNSHKKASENGRVSEERDGDSDFTSGDVPSRGCPEGREARAGKARGDTKRTPPRTRFHLRQL